ncbi:hypothetical protein [Tenacibaculum sp. M341]|uniref:hypothetical protein n=1 Tax=Tenacibaculum sp. M341 TaxID=2530339 RepID=UPI00104E1F05|nr:hypothetical protein [Tenacibaculum sp. M341]TCI85234.1 hypothetical protein EYW44_17465 [Tenacibaculum sp. M341]
MNIFRKKDEILAALGNMKAMKRIHVDTYTEERIKNVSGVKIAESKQGQIWVEFQELNGYLFMNATILSRVDLTVTQKAKIILLTDEYEIEIDADQTRIESDFSNVSNTWITEVSFTIENKEMEIIQNKAFEEIEYHFNKRTISLLAIK